MTAHPEDFFDAHRRHWEDAEIFLGSHRWANADQLYGLSAECCPKAVMKTLGMPVDATGTPKARKHLRYVQKLWPIFETFAGDRDGARYLSPLPSGRLSAD